MNMGPNGDFTNPNVFAKYAVNRAGEIEAVRQPLYDYQAYAQAGQTSLTFFAIPRGQAGKTLADTNMDVAGSLANPKRFLVLGISIVFFPGLFPSATPAQVGIDNFANDTWEVFSGAAWLDFFIGSKSYLQAPVNSFPCTTRLSGWSSQSSGGDPTVDEFVRTSYAASSGAPFALNPPLMLEPTQNFNVTINWPTPVGISAAGRIGIHLHGVLYRNSQ
jgi:hypothetical protein